MRKALLIILCLLVHSCTAETPQQKQLRKLQKIREKYGLSQPADSIVVQTTVVHDPCDSISEAYKKLLEEVNSKPDTIKIMVPPPNTVIPTVTVKKVANNKKKKHKTVKVEQPTKVNNKVDYAVHIVKKGETLYSIAKQYNKSPNEIKTYNGLKSSTVVVGQRIKIKI